jgi:putative oxidoreductase
MRHAPLVARILLGLIFFGAGLAGLLNLAPPPADLPENMKTFMAGMEATRFFFPLLKVTETLCGIFLLSGLFVPLALVVLAPVVVNILLVHTFMAPEGLVLTLVIVALHIYLSFFAKPYKNALKPLFKAKA